ncbi:hypothetical protein Q8W40_10980 [Vibrio penaeicida]|uniref:hypothetical protein n=1 Tax=Vibrio penaeicida TaxID=104609 RepID=UPI0027327115|nr:hypothetical protein [Vibrio penaeicida]MDP2572707.1 hypothetical protein [Vibrio penaeicida]
MIKNITLFSLASLLLSFPSYGKWLSTSGTITSLTTYGHTNTVLVSLTDQGANITECSNKTTFAISSSLDPEARSRMYSMLLAARASGKAVTISYSDVGGCEPWDRNLNVYRRITRLIH